MCLGPMMGVRCLDQDDTWGRKLGAEMGDGARWEMVFRVAISQVSRIFVPADVKLLLINPILHKRRSTCKWLWYTKCGKCYWKCLQQ